MIRIHIDSTVPSVTAQGHAGYAQRGQDIVCAAVSTLMYTLVRNLELNVYDACWEADIGEGHARIEIFPDRIAQLDVSMDFVMDIFQTVINGLLMLEEQYGKYIRCECE